MKQIATFQMFREMFGRRLRATRKAAHLSQESLGFEIGCSRNHISQLERGKDNPSFVTLYQLACALHVEVSYLFDFEDEQDGPPAVHVPSPCED